MKLKRCPFCNTHDLTLDVTSATYAVKCFECGAMGPVTTRTPQRAADLWNSGPIGTTAMVNMKRKFTNRDDLKEVDIA